MAKGPTKRVVMNRAALDAMALGLADGLLAMGTAILEDAVAHAPHDEEKAAERGVAPMRETGGVYVEVNGRKVGGNGNKPPSRTRSTRMGGYRSVKGAASMAVGFGSPIAHFAELGTVKENARPFLTPAFDRGLPGASDFVLPAVGKRLREAPPSELERGLGALLGVKSR